MDKLNVGDKIVINQTEYEIIEDDVYYMKYKMKPKDGQWCYISYELVNMIRQKGELK